MFLFQSSTGDPPFNLIIVCNDIEECIEVQIKRTIETHKYCCICFVSNEHLVVAHPQDARMQYWIKWPIFIPDGNWRCSGQLINNCFYGDDLILLKVYCNLSILRTLDLTKIKSFNSLRRENLMRYWDLLTAPRNTNVILLVKLSLYFYLTYILAIQTNWYQRVYNKTLSFLYAVETYVNILTFTNCNFPNCYYLRSMFLREEIADYFSFTNLRLSRRPPGHL